MNNEEIILKELLRKEPQHIRELARNTSLHPNTIITTVNTLEKSNIIKTEKEDKKQVFYENNQKAKNRKVFYIIEEIISSGLIKHLEEYYSYPAIILFGSTAKGEFHENSDIDIAIITDDKKSADLRKFEKKLNKEIQTFIFNKAEFKKLNKELFNNIVNGIVLSGFAEVK
ncbi:nucleotidyltransferase domain-containing protein [Candidatus Woesearchaeota archaeon]|nr:nucleotidyltransferase domain-containing protein [Candidatus Woesearchaeota archaeon]